MPIRRNQWKEWKPHGYDRTTLGFIANAKSLNVDVVHFAPSLLLNRCRTALVSIYSEQKKTKQSQFKCLDAVARRCSTYAPPDHREKGSRSMSRFVGRL